MSNYGQQEKTSARDYSSAPFEVNSYFSGSALTVAGKTEVEGYESQIQTGWTRARWHR
jgi:hypothetical protein